MESGSQRDFQCAAHQPVRREDASVLRRDAEPPAARAGRALWPAVARAGRDGLATLQGHLPFRVREPHFKQWATVELYGVSN